MIWIVRKPYAPGFIIVYPLIEIGLLLKILYFYIQISRNNFFRWLSISLYDGLGYRYVYIFLRFNDKKPQVGIWIICRSAHTGCLYGIGSNKYFRIELYCKNKIFLIIFAGSFNWIC